MYLHLLVQQHADQQREGIGFQQGVGLGFLNKLQFGHVASLGRPMPSDPAEQTGASVGPQAPVEDLLRRQRDSSVRECVSRECAIVVAITAGHAL